MRKIVGVGCLLAALACTDSSARGVSAPEGVVGRGGQVRSVAGGVPAIGQGIAGRPLGGAGTDSTLAIWTSPTTLGDAPAKINANGDLILRPGTGIIVLSADGTKCWRVAGEAITKLTPNCPTY